MDYEVTLSDVGFTRRQRVEKAAATLAGLLEGLAIDRALNLDEIRELRAWLRDHAALASRHPFSELAPAVSVALADGRLDEEERADLLWLCDRLAGEGGYWDAPTDAMQRLHGIFHGVLADGHLEDAEIRGLRDWVEENRWLQGVYPYDELESHLTSILADGCIDENERGALSAFLADFVRPTLTQRIAAARAGETLPQALSGCCAVDPELRFEPGVEYAWTGASTRATRTQIAGIVVDRGGEFSPSVTRRTAFLVVGAGSNPAWAYTCYGRKVEQAMKLRQAGVRLAIVHESDFWDALE